MSFEDNPRNGTQNPVQEPTDAEPVWTYRGYRLRASEFTTAMVHLFRAEVARANVWRQRLDTTTNWAVVTTGAAISIAFSQSAINHFVIILNAMLITMFLIIEARRYRYYELWSSRVRLMETDFFAAMLVPPFHPASDWAESLAENLLHPQFPISELEAVGRRLRRNYLWIYSVLIAAWMMKLWSQPSVANSWQQFIQRAEIAPIDGQWILIFMLCLFGLLLLVALGTIGLQEASGEVHSRYGDLFNAVIGLDQGTRPATEHDDTKRKPGKLRAWFRPTKRRPQVLTFIVTDQAESMAKRIFSDMGRGVTSLAGTGMYTGYQHSVLMCAVTMTEITHLKALVAEVDQKAFVIISPAQGIYGKGFLPLEEVD